MSNNRDKYWNLKPVSSTIVKNDTGREYEYEKWRIVNGLDKIRCAIVEGQSLGWNKNQISDILSHAASRIVTNTNYISSVRQALIDFVCWADGQSKYEKCIDKLMQLLDGHLSLELVSKESLCPEYERLQKMVEQLLDGYGKCIKSGLEADKCISFIDDRFKNIDETIQVIKYLKYGFDKDSDKKNDDKEANVNISMPRSKAKIASDIVRLKKENIEMKEKLNRYETKYDKERIERFECLYGSAKSVVNSLKKNGPNNQDTENRIREFLGITKSIMAYNEEKEKMKDGENCSPKE